MTDVKNALQAAGWDLDKAVQELRKKGLAAASKKASRHAAEGLVGISKTDRAAAAVEINSETDFVARNDQFRSLVSSAAAAALQLPPTAVGAGCELDLEALKDAKLEDGTRLEDAVVGVAGSVRENIRLRRGFAVAVPEGGRGLVGSYLHTAAAPGLGRIAGLVALQSGEELGAAAAAAVQEPSFPRFLFMDKVGPSSSPGERVTELAGKLAMHVVGTKPQYLSREHVPEDALAAERALLTEQALKSGKPANIVERMVAGRLGKFYEEWCLLEQPYILDDSQKVKDVLAAAAKQAGCGKLQVTSFVRVQVGEGLEAEQKDFAAEVAETLKAVA
ncbi:hypothetical protein N2152v2_010659 [Parachlorella kessleri]